MINAAHTGQTPAEPAAPPAPVFTTDRLAELDALRRSTVDAVLWQRTLPATLQAELDRIATQEIEDARFLAAAPDVGDAVIETLLARDLKRTPTVGWLAADIGALAQRFATITDTTELELRLEWIDHNACPRFHRDNVSARLLCTYSGPGTEYGALPDGGDTPEAIHTAPLACPMLFRGKLWAEASPNPLVHRSPLIEGTGARRLMLAINPPLPGIAAMAS
jgi:hypothetical protein